VTVNLKCLLGKKEQGRGMRKERGGREGVGGNDKGGGEPDMWAPRAGSW
jgi:hypothetical protein